MQEEAELAGGNATGARNHPAAEGHDGAWIAYLFLVILFAAMLGTAGAVYFRTWDSYQSRLYYSAAGYPAIMRKLGRPIAVPTALLERRPIPVRLSASGLMEYRDTVDVKSEVPGVVTDVLVKPGDRVVKGQVLADVNTGGVEMRLSQLDLDAARERLDHAKTDYDREKEALAKGTTPRSSFDRVDRDYREAQIAYARAQEQYFATFTSRSSLILNRPAPADARRRPNEVDIQALSDGTVLQVTATVGSSISGPNSVLMTVGRDLRFRAPFDQQLFGEVHQGDSATVYLRALPDTDLHGHVVEKEAVITPVSRERKDDPPYAFSVWISVEVPEGMSVLPGMNGFAILETERTSVLAPSGAVSRYSGREGTVMVVDAKHRARVRRVRYGVTEGDWVEILEGVQEGERVVRNGQLALRDGDAVNVTGAK